MDQNSYNQERLKQNAEHGHSPDNAIFRTNNTSLFTNSKCIFIEYCDGLALPWMIFLSVLPTIPNIDKLFNLTQIECLDEYGLMEWYVNRKHRNPLYDLCHFDVDGELTDEQSKFVSELDGMLEEALDNPYIFDVELTTNAAPMIQHLLAAEFVPKVVVYHPVENPYIKQSIDDMFGAKAELKTGELEDVLQEIPDDSLYFFSNAESIPILEDIGKLDYSAILVAQDYAYNWVSDDEFIVDFDELEKEHIFKYGYFAACSTADIEEENDNEDKEGNDLC